MQKLDLEATATLWYVTYKLYLSTYSGLNIPQIKGYRAISKVTFGASGRYDEPDFTMMTHRKLSIH
jgi:hypothetical protein